MYLARLIVVPLLAGCYALPAMAAAPPQDPIVDDRPLEEPLVLPDWFQLSFLELHDDLQAAVRKGKRGLLLYFGQKDCPYCKALLEVNWGRPDIVTYTRRHFDVVAIDVKGDRLVTRLDGTVVPEGEYSVQVGAQFTPTLVFLDADGRVALKLVGYHHPYQFRAALEYVADGHYKRESFREYLARGDLDEGAGQTVLRQRELFEPPPYALDRSRFPGQRPLVVFFEEIRCHPCDVLHLGPLSEPEILARLRKFDRVQLDMWADTPVITPGGERLSARQWADRLGLFYAPTLVFFDERGREILRVDSVVRFYRLRGVLDYVLSGAYKTFPTYRQWRNRGAGG